MDPTNAKVESIIRDGLREAHGSASTAKACDVSLSQMAAAVEATESAEKLFDV